MEKTYSQRLKEILFLLASSADTQIGALPGFVHIPDEIASETSDAVNFAPNMSSAVDEGILGTLKEICQMFDGMAGKADLWTVDSVKENPVWQQIRLLAQAEIDRQQLRYKKPDLFWVSYYQNPPR